MLKIISHSMLQIKQQISTTVLVIMIGFVLAKCWIPYFGLTICRLMRNPNNNLMMTGLSNMWPVSTFLRFFFPTRHSSFLIRFDFEVGATHCTGWVGEEIFEEFVSNSSSYVQSPSFASIVCDGIWEVFLFASQIWIQDRLSKIFEITFTCGIQLSF